MSSKMLRISHYIQKVRTVAMRSRATHTHRLWKAVRLIKATNALFSSRTAIPEHDPTDDIKEEDSSGPKRHYSTPAVYHTIVCKADGHFCPSASCNCILIHERTRVGAFPHTQEPPVDEDFRQAMARVVRWPGTTVLSSQYLGNCTAIVRHTRWPNGVKERVFYGYSNESWLEMLSGSHTTAEQDWLAAMDAMNELSSGLTGKCESTLASAPRLHLPSVAVDIMVDASTQPNGRHLTGPALSRTRFVSRGIGIDTLPTCGGRLDWCSQVGAPSCASYYFDAKDDEQDASLVDGWTSSSILEWSLSASEWHFYGDETWHDSNKVAGDGHGPAQP